MTRPFYSLNDIFELFSSDFEKALCEVQSAQLFTNGFPPYNVKVNEKTNDLRFEFALAGYEKQNIDISFDGDYMFLELKPTKEEDKEFKTIQRGIKGGKGKIKLAVPESRYDRENARGEFKDGILVARKDLSHKVGDVAKKIQG